MTDPGQTGTERQGWEYECFECGYEEESIEDSPQIPLRECPECSDGRLHHVGPVVDQCDDCGADLLYNGNAGLGGYHEETLCDNCYDRRQSLVTDGGIDRHEWIQKQLAKLDMVQWDRFTVGEDAHGERFVNVYGWIGREHDGYKDFVLLMFWPELGENGILGYTTSSDDHTREIHRRLFGDEPGHNDCQRVEHTFDIENAVELDPTEQRTLTDGGEPQESGVEREPVVQERPDFDLYCIPAKPNTWTFQNDAVRRFVEERLHGRVLNLFAGKTKLHHDGEIVRVDLDDDRDADHHFDAIEVRERFGEAAFDTVILDPPFSVQQSRKRYNGDYRGHFTHVKDEVSKVVRPGGRTLTFGYHSRAMGPSRGFDREDLAVFDFGGRFRAMLGVVEQRVERDLGEFQEPVSARADGGRNRSVGTGTPQSEGSQ